MRCLSYETCYCFGAEFYNISYVQMACEAEVGVWYFVFTAVK